MKFAPMRMNFEIRGAPRKGEDVRPVLDAMEAMEQVIPGLTLYERIPGEPVAPTRELREAWVSRRLNHDPGGVVGAESGKDLAVNVIFHDICTVDDKRTRLFLETWIMFRDDRAAGRERELLLRVGDALRAAFGTCAPAAAHDALVYQDVTLGKDGPPFEPAPFGLPALYGRDMPQGNWAPEGISWLNYWAPGVAHWLGFPDPTRDQAWFSLATRSATSAAWVMAVTEDPLDLNRPEHVEAMRRAWQRFDRIGVRQPTPRMIERWAAKGLSL